MPLDVQHSVLPIENAPELVALQCHAHAKLRTYFYDIS